MAGAELLQANVSGFSMETKGISLILRPGSSWTHDGPTCAKGSQGQGSSRVQYFAHESSIGRAELDGSGGGDSAGWHPAVVAPANSPLRARGRILEGLSSGFRWFPLGFFGVPFVSLRSPWFPSFRLFEAPRCQSDA